MQQLAIIRSIGLGMVVAWSATVLNAQPAPEKPGTLTLTVRVAGENGPTPAMVVISDAAGKFYTADNAIPWDKTTGDEKESATKLPLKEVVVDFQTRVFNPYNRTEHWYTPGESTLNLPAGLYRVRLYKGFEYLVETRDVVVEPEQTSRVLVTMNRWADMPAAGWYSSDAHIHMRRPSPELNEPYSKMMRAVDLHVANILEWGHSKGFHNDAQYAHGPAGIHQHDHFILAAGQENPRTHFLGHGIVLGAKSRIEFPDQYLIYRLVWEEAHRQGALAGAAHRGKGRGAESEVAMDIPHRLLDFIEVVQLGGGDYTIWYDILNTGFRITPVAGTDFPYGNSLIPGRERFYTQVDGEFNYANWLEGVRLGRTFVTNGPMLEMTVNGKGIGSEVELDSPGRVTVEGEVRFDPARDEVQVLELIENGQVVQTFKRQGDDPVIRCRVEHEVKEGAWLALRATGKKVEDLMPPIMWPYNKEAPTRRAPSMAHTGVVYVSVRGAPGMAEQPRAKALAKKWIGWLDELDGKLKDGEVEKLATWPAFADGVELDVIKRDRPALLEAIDSARSHFQKLAK